MCLTTVDLTQVSCNFNNQPVWDVIQTVAAKFITVRQKRLWPEDKNVYTLKNSTDKLTFAFCEFLHSSIIYICQFFTVHMSNSSPAGQIRSMAQNIMDSRYDIYFPLKPRNWTLKYHHMKTVHYINYMNTRKSNRATSYPSYYQPWYWLNRNVLHFVLSFSG